MNTSQLDKICKALRLGQVASPGKALQSLLRDAGIQGSLHGTVTFSPQDAKRLLSILHDRYGVSNSLLDGTAELEGAGRSSDLKLHRFEKAQRTAIRETVIVGAQTGQPLYIDGRDVAPHEGGTLNIQKSDAHRLDVPGVILVENWEAIRDFHKLRFPVPIMWKSYVLVFRGMPHVSSQRHVQSFLTDLAKPVVCFPDMDPAGLGMAQSVPGFSGLLWPGQSALERLVAGRHGRQDLFEAQEAQYRDRLDASDGDIALAWQVIRNARRGIVQEVFLNQEDSDM